MRKTFLLILCLLLLLPTVALANPVDEWTLATIPELELVSSNDTVHTIRIKTDNANGTEMLIERSVDSSFTNPILFEDWKPYSNGDTFTITLEEGETAYLRIKARNGNYIETDYSSVLAVHNKPPRPTASYQHSTEDKIEIEFTPVQGATVFKVERKDKGQEEVVTGTKYMDTSVAPAREYTYEFWAENNGVPSEKNILTIWTKPRKPLVHVKEITTHSITLEVDLLDNPADITIEAVDNEGNNLPITGNLITVSHLQPGTEYTFQVRLKSANNEYTDWVTVVAKTSNTSSGGGGGMAPILEDEKAFIEKAKQIIQSIEYKVDGRINSGSAWIDVRTNHTTYTVEATVDGSTKKLSTNFVRFDNLKDNHNYSMKITVKSVNYTYSDTINVKTPNRTPPKVEGGYYDQEKNELIVNVSTKSKLSR